MEKRRFLILDAVAIEGRGHVLLLTLGRHDELPIGTAVEVVGPDGSVFRSTVRAVEAFMVPPPPEPGTGMPFGVRLVDEPGEIPDGSVLFSIT